MKNKKIIFLTSGRGDYFLLSPLVSEIKNLKNNKIYFASIGDSYFKKNKEDFINKIDFNLEKSKNKVTPIKLILNLSLIYLNFFRLIKKIKPNSICLLGDRSEILMPSIICFFLKIPLIHFYGGEISEGATDNYIRKIVSILSSYHLTAHKNSKNNLLKLGVPKNKIHVIGSLGIENFLKLKLLQKIEIEKKLNFVLKKKNILVTYHPVTNNKDYGLREFRNLISFLKKQKNTNIFFTYPNKDIFAYQIRKTINNFKNKKNFYVFESLGILHYFSLVKQMDVVMGNSSSGIIEVPSLNVPVINIGDRQKNRYCSKSVIQCSTNPKDLEKSLKKAYSRSFLSSIKKYKNPYESKNVHKKIIIFLKKNKLIN
tara:strand:- start:556 stop:1665 length:1110 start_codon:yes stop_codon:yes gene_type:complete